MRNTLKIIAVVMFGLGFAVLAGSTFGRYACSAPTPNPQPPAPAAVPPQDRNPQPPEPDTRHLTPTRSVTYLVYPDGTKEQIPFNLPIERNVQVWYSGRITRTWCVDRISYQVFETYTARDLHVEELCAAR